VVTLLTQVEVDPKDPAIGQFTKPIGPAYPPAQAARLAAEGSAGAAEFETLMVSMLLCNPYQ